MGKLISYIRGTFIYDQFELSIFPKEIMTEKNKLYLNMENRNSELFISCYYKKDFRTYTFSKTFSLENFKQEYPLFHAYSNIDRIINELKTKKLKSIEGDEENSNTINVIISTNLTEFPIITLGLNRVNLSLEEQLRESSKTIIRYELACKIFGLEKSQILIGKDNEKISIKPWISQKDVLKATLLYSYYTGAINDLKKEITFEIKEDENNPKQFHEKCDNKNNILIICKSKDEIFGGFTPLCFDCSSGYKSDKKSFLFSLNKREKYSNDPSNSSKSILCDISYGPCFCDDLFFLKNFINVVTFNKNEYLTDKRWVNKRNCYTKSDMVILDKLEIFQIEEISFDENFMDINNFYNRINNEGNHINRSYNNNHNIHNNNHNNFSNNNNNNNRNNNNNNNNSHINRNNNNSNTNISNNNSFNNNNNNSNRSININSNNNSNNNINNHSNYINNNLNRRINANRTNNNIRNNDNINRKNKENSCRNITGSQINRNTNNNRIITVRNTANQNENNVNRRDVQENQTQTNTEEIPHNTSISTLTDNPILQYEEKIQKERIDKLKINLIEYLTSNRQTSSVNHS